MRSIHAITSLALLLLLSFSALGAESVEGKAEAVRLFDDFDGRLALQPGAFMLRETDRSVAGSWVIDTSRTPKSLTAYLRTGTELTPLRWAYAIDGDTLTLCTILKPNAEAPDSLDTEEGDGHMVLTLRRTEAEE